jgi:hypothetical protein
VRRLVDIQFDCIAHDLDGLITLILYYIGRILSASQYHPRTKLKVKKGEAPEEPIAHCALHVRIALRIALLIAHYAGPIRILRWDETVYQTQRIILLILV